MMNVHLKSVFVCMCLGEDDQEDWGAVSQKAIALLGG